jgi:hypothetical protein
VIEVTVTLNDEQQAQAERRAEQADLPVNVWIQRIVEREVALAFANSMWPRR